MSKCINIMTSFCYKNVEIYSYIIFKFAIVPDKHFLHTYLHFILLIPVKYFSSKTWKMQSVGLSNIRFTLSIQLLKITVFIVSSSRRMGWKIKPKTKDTICHLVGMFCREIYHIAFIINNNKRVENPPLTV